MDREQTRQQIKTEWRTLITGITRPARQKVNREASYICPLCGHGTHGDGIARNPKSEDGNSLKCFGCGFSGDIIDLYQKAQGVDYNKALKELAEQLGIELEKGSSAKVAPVQQKKKQEVKTENYIDYFQKVQSSRSEAPAQEYLKSRGISEEVAAKYWLGYDQEYSTFNIDEDGQQSFTKWRALIIPTGKGSYIARNIDNPQPNEKKNRYRKKGANVIFNSKALYTANKPIFVVEGEIDALSIIEAGGEALGLGSTSNYIQLISLLKKKPTKQPLILALDADKDGKATEEKLAAELTALGMSFYRYNLYGAAKDANEALLLDRKGFISEIKAAEQAQQAELEAAAEAVKQDYLKTSAANVLQDFLGGIKEGADTPAIHTGFKALDKALDGGLYEGLYIIGAISSLGKTTLALQIVDQIAQQGHDCIIFSLEMAKQELIAKSISRHTFLLAESKEDAKTTRGIIAGARWKNYSEEEKGLINKALSNYKEYAQHIYIHEGIGDIGVNKVKDTVQQHIAITGNRPVVLIDYLQILAPYDMRASDKQNTDKATLELKRLSRDFKIPVIGISSFNRDNYTAPVNNASFKESGAIEYSADVLIGLQYEGMDYQEGEVDGIRQKRIRELIRTNEDKARQGEAQIIQAKILKNRNASKCQSLFSFYAMFNCFKEYVQDFQPDNGTGATIFNGMKAK